MKFVSIVEDWRRLLRHAWTIRLIILAAVLSGLEVVIPVFADNPPISRGAFAGVSFVVTAAAFVARIFAHENWRLVLRCAWSIRLLALSAALSGMEVAFAAFVDHPPIEPGRFAVLSGLVTVAAFGARFVAQKEFE